MLFRAWPVAASVVGRRLKNHDHCVSALCTLHCITGNIVVTSCTQARQSIYYIIASTLGVDSIAAMSSIG